MQTTSVAKECPATSSCPHTTSGTASEDTTRYGADAATRSCVDPDGVNTVPPRASRRGGSVLTPPLGSTLPAAVRTGQRTLPPCLDPTPLRQGMPFQSTRGGALEPGGAARSPTQIKPRRDSHRNVGGSGRGACAGRRRNDARESRRERQGMPGTVVGVTRGAAIGTDADGRQAEKALTMTRVGRVSGGPPGRRGPWPRPPRRDAECPW